MGVGGGVEGWVSSGAGHVIRHARRWRPAALVRIDTSRRHMLDAHGLSQWREVLCRCELARAAGLHPPQGPPHPGIHPTPPRCAPPPQQQHRWAAHRHTAAPRVCTVGWGVWPSSPRRPVASEYQMQPSILLAGPPTRPPCHHAPYSPSRPPSWSAAGPGIWAARRRDTSSCSSNSSYRMTACPARHQHAKGNGHGTATRRQAHLLGLTTGGGSSNVHVR